MLAPFLIALRESLQASFLLGLALHGSPARTDRSCKRSLLSGFLLAATAGGLAGAAPFLSSRLGSHETWAFWRMVSEAALFYGSMVLLLRSLPASRGLVGTGLFLLGSLLPFFEARSLGFIVHDLGVAAGRVPAAFASAAGGVVLGALLVPAFRLLFRRIPLERVFSPASLLLSLGALQFWFGGLSELGGESILSSLQHGLQLFINEFMKSVQAALLVPDHPFLDVTLAGLARYLGSDRTAMTMTVLFLMAPPVTVLAVLFARPDPETGGIAEAARRRQDIAAFREDLFLRSAPVLGSFLVLVVLLHAVNVSMNPLYDPEPLPVREAEGTGTIRIPIAGPAGDLGDKKLRKYVYYAGSRQVLFLAVMRPDGSLGVALDQCEICRPADWNKNARGYAQQGENLFCKYCVTPITANTVNTPGGCNPIPVAFQVRENTIVIDAGQLVILFDKAEALERKGTHL